MNPFTAYRLHITPLSPVHIGTGESYEPTHYVIEDEALHEFDTGTAMAALLAQDRAELLKIASGKPNADMLKDLQRFFYEERRRKTLQACAINSIPVLPGIAELYDKRVGKTANREGDGKQVINRLEIDRAAYNPITRKPVLLGSSLKGAMRTALLDWKNQDQPLRTVPDHRTGRMNKENNQALQQRLLDFKAGKFELDPLRLVQLADAYWQGEEGLPAGLVQLAVNRKKHPVKDEHGNLRESQAEKKNLYHILECVPGWHCRAFTGQLNLQNLGNLRDERRLPAADLRFDIENIARACHDFYEKRMDKENQILRDRGFLDSAWDKAVSDVLAKTQAKFDAGQAFLLRVGRHSGAESVTLNGDNVRNIKILLDKDKVTGKQNYTYENKTRTLWLAANEIDQGTNLQPFGWLLVEVEPLENQPQDWPELRELCEPQLKTARAFAKQRESQREALAQARAETEAKRREEVEQERIRAKQKAETARQETARQAQLAAMSEQARQVETFRQKMEREANLWVSQGIGGGWFRELGELAQRAEAWTAEDRAALLGLVQAVSQLSPNFSPKKNDRIKKLIKSFTA